MFTRFLTLLVFILVGVLVTLIFVFGEEFSEKILPIFFAVTVVIYLFLSWYLGYFVSTQKPPLELVVIAGVGLAVACMSGYYMGR